MLLLWPIPNTLSTVHSSDLSFVLAMRASEKGMGIDLPLSESLTYRPFGKIPQSKGENISILRSITHPTEDRFDCFVRRSSGHPWTHNVHHEPANRLQLHLATIENLSRSYHDQHVAFSTAREKKQTKNIVDHYSVLEQRKNASKRPDAERKGGRCAGVRSKDTKPGTLIQQY